MRKVLSLWSSLTLWPQNTSARFALASITKSPVSTKEWYVSRWLEKHQYYMFQNIATSKKFLFRFTQVKLKLFWSSSSIGRIYRTMRHLCRLALLWSSRVFKDLKPSAAQKAFWHKEIFLLCNQRRARLKALLLLPAILSTDTTPVLHSFYFCWLCFSSNYPLLYKRFVPSEPTARFARLPCEFVSALIFLFSIFCLFFGVNCFPIRVEIFHYFPRTCLKYRRRVRFAPRDGRRWPRHVGVL